MKETVITGEWMDTESVMRELKIGERTVQKWAELGWLPFKTVQDGSRRFRLYDARAVDKLRESGPPRKKAGPKPPPDMDLSSLPALPPPPPRRSSNFSLPEGKVSVSFPAQLSEESTAQARTFVELVLRQLG